MLCVRYADIIVHRLLLAALEKSDWWAGGEVSSTTAQLFNNTLLQVSLLLRHCTRCSDKNESRWIFKVYPCVQELCQHINTRNRAAQVAQRTSAQLFQTLYFKVWVPFFKQNRASIEGGGG